MTDETHTRPAIPAVETLPPEARFSLRAREGHLDRIAGALGMDLPRRIGERTQAEGRTALCLGPDEWLVTAPEDHAAPLRDAMAGNADAAPHAFADISDREIGYRLSGTGAADIVAMGCPRDLRAIPPGRAVRTVFDGASVILWRDGPDAFRIDVWRSFAPHALALIETGLEELRAGL